MQIRLNEVLYDETQNYTSGGRSVMANFAAVQSVANRAIKNDSILQTLDPQEMACGLQLEQLLALVRCGIQTKTTSYSLNFFLKYVK